MNTRYLLTACIALFSLVCSQSAQAEVTLLSDVVAGAQGSAITPVGRLGSDLLMVASTDAGEMELFASRAPSGAITKIATLSTSRTSTRYVYGGAFFSIPAGLSGAGSHWFTDGSAEGTFSVPFAPGWVFQRNQDEVFYKNPSVAGVGRYNVQTGENNPSYIPGGGLTVRAIVGGTPLHVSTSGVVSAFDFSTRKWRAVIDQDFESMGIYTPVYTGENNDKLYIAGAVAETDSLYGHYVYQVTSNLDVVRKARLDFSSTPRQITLQLQSDSWVFRMTSSSGDEEAFTVDSYTQPYYRYDSRGGISYPVGVNTFVGSLGFVENGGRLFSSDGQTASKPHEFLRYEQEAITVTHLRIVGDSLLIFGSTPSRGSEVWITQTDSCPVDQGKLYPGICGCGASETDADRDGTPDCIDSCRYDAAKIAPGACGCGSPDLDPDGDGAMSCVDLCPLDPGKRSPGVCGCGTADTDTDGDGTPDCKDRCASDASKTSPGVCGCGIVDADSDADGTPDCRDQCPNSSTKLIPGVCGCDVLDIDSDGDRVVDCIDQCPSDSAKVGPGVCGCGVADSDHDGDGAASCVDQCPTDGAKILPGIAGCGLSDIDTDGDAVPDALDLCPVDRAKSAPGACGCNAADQDADGDGQADCRDECPADSAKTVAGQCGCGVADTDSDGDLAADCADLCPEEPTLTAPQGGSCEPRVALNDACPLDPSKLTPGNCGCGVPDTDGNANGVLDCLERAPVSVDAPVVSTRTKGRTSRLVVGMVNVGSATYHVEATRLDVKGGKRLTKTFRSASGVITGLPAKSRWSVRYRVLKGGEMSAWSTATRVRIK